MPGIFYPNPTDMKVEALYKSPDHGRGSMNGSFSFPYLGLEQADNNPSVPAIVALVLIIKKILIK
jgi:hypothetical protein